MHMRTRAARGRIGNFTYEFEAETSTLWLENTRNGWTGSYQAFEADPDAEPNASELRQIHLLADRLGAD